MINYLRFVDPKLLEKALRERLGSRQAKPTALKRDRAPGAPHRLDERSSAHGCGAPSLGRAWVEPRGARTTWTQRFGCWAVPLVSFGWRLVSF
jgi:hypothetical protein